MNRKKIISLTIIILVILIISFIFFKTNYNNKSKIKFCKDIKKSIELTSEQNYCLGGGCSEICSEKTNECAWVLKKEQCEKIDIVNQQLESGQDGISDCKWIEGNDPINSCRPNK